MVTRRTGLLVIRAWVEDRSAERRRAQIRVIDDLTTGGHRSLTLVQPDTVTEFVDAWLHTILATAGPRLRSTTTDSHVPVTLRCHLGDAAPAKMRSTGAVRAR